LHPSLPTCHLAIPKSMPDREGPKKICHEFPEETKINESKEHTCCSAQLIIIVVVVERKNHLRDPARRLPTGPPLPPARASRRRRPEPAGDRWEIWKRGGIRSLAVGGAMRGAEGAEAANAYRGFNALKPGHSSSWIELRTDESR
jgi:hypothetical protein